MDAFLSAALDAADAAARIQRRDAHRASPRRATEKARADYVSETDLDAQEAAVQLLRARFPDHAILAEEGESVEEQLARWDGRPLWIVDPLDGTTNFLHGHPFHCASVGLAVDGRLVAGAVASGASRERWWAAEGGGAFKDGGPIRVSEGRSFREALVGTGFPFKATELLPRYLPQLDRVLRASSGVRRGGSAALDLCFLAEGILDAFWEELLMPWDIAAGAVIVREAGGLVTGPDGKTLELTAGPIRGANGPETMSTLLEVLAGR